MRRLALAFAAGALIACGNSGPIDGRASPADEITAVPSPTFADPELQEIATHLAEEAERHGIRAVHGRWNRVESLLQLEAELGEPPLAFEHVNAVAIRAVRTDSGHWPSIRAQAFERCRSRDDETCVRVRDLLQRWYRHRLAIVTEDLGDERRVYRYGGSDWERSFHDFISRKPRDAATWGWIVSRHAAREVHGAVGRNDGEAAYLYYLAMTRLGTRHEAAAVFSVPGVAVRER